jgi:hypothetical protein
MNAKIVNEVAQFPFWQNMFRIFSTVQLMRWVAKLERNRQRESQTIQKLRQSLKCKNFILLSGMPCCF